MHLIKKTEARTRKMWGWKRKKKERNKQVEKQNQPGLIRNGEYGKKRGRVSKWLEELKNIMWITWKKVWEFGLKK